MADTTTITGLPNATPLDGTERVPMDQAGTTVDATTAAIAATLPDATTSVAGKMSAADKTKLNGIASGATANSSDATLLARANHTGTQAATTITGLATVATSGAYGDLSGRPTLGTAAATDATAYAPAAQGVTNGNSHDHSGGDGGTIAYSSLSGLPSLGGAASLNVGTTTGTVSAGDDARFHDSVTLGASVADVLGLTGQQITADDPGGDRLLFWDDSEGKLTHLTLGTNLSITGTTINASGGSGGGDVSISGTPTTGQVAEWVSGSAIQGVATTGSGNYVRATSPTLVTPALGTPASGTLTNCTGLPAAGVTGLGSLATQSAIGNITSAGAIGSTASLPIITGASGVLGVGSFGTTAGTFCQGNDSRLSDARTPTAHNQAWSTITSTPTTLSGYGITDAQPLDSDLTSIAALTTTTFGRSFLDRADAAAGRTHLGLGSLATQSGTFSGTSSGTNTGDQTISNSSDATSHTVTLSASGGTVQFVEGSNITLTTTGSSSAGVVTIAATGGGGGGNILYFDAAEFIPRTTAGCGVSSEETATNRINRDLLLFDAANQQFAQKGFAWPEGWATATAAYFWETTTGTGSCVLGARMRVFTDGDAEDQAMGTGQVVVDAAASANTHRQTAATPAITPGGTVTAGKHCILEIYREPGNVSDDIAVPIKVIGVVLTKAS